MKPIKWNCGLPLLLITTMVFVNPSGFVLAELPPSAYKAFRAKAPEVVKIRVLAVKTQNLPERLGVEVQAQVLAVQRSKSRLRPSTILRIVYEIDRRGMPGPRPLVLLEAGKTYQAFLQKDGQSFKPAALAASFDVVGQN